MLLNKDEAEKLDRILFHLIQNDTARVKYKQIQDILNVGFNEAKYLHELILSYHHNVEPVVGIHNALNISKKQDVTEVFLNKGGFELVYQKQSESKDDESKTWPKDQLLKNSESWFIRNYWISFVVSVLGFIMGLIALIISLR